jgi:hypothetical protein
MYVINLFEFLDIDHTALRHHFVITKVLIFISTRLLPTTTTTTNGLVHTQKFDIKHGCIRICASVCHLWSARHSHRAGPATVMFTHATSSAASCVQAPVRVSSLAQIHAPTRTRLPASGRIIHSRRKHLCYRAQVLLKREDGRKAETYRRTNLAETAAVL